MDKKTGIFVCGENGLVGSAVCRKLEAEGYPYVLTLGRNVDLRSADLAKHFLPWERVGKKIEYIFMCAAKVGGIMANKNFPADFIHDNLQIQNNLIHTAHKTGVKKLCFLGSSCIYPRDCPQPIKEEYLLTGPLEETNKAYAVAKIAGIEMVRSYSKQYGLNGICLMPTNLYGQGDNFSLENAHVLPALIRKFHTAKVNRMKTVECWGTGAPRREFLHVDDLADAAIFLMQKYDSPEPINVGCGEDVTVKELSEMVASTVGFEGEIVWNTEKPDGTPRKLLDVSKIRDIGWKPKITLKDGIDATYKWYLEAIENNVHIRT